MNLPNTVARGASSRDTGTYTNQEKMTMEETQSATATEADLRAALHDAMDGNLRQSRRRDLLNAYRAAILANAHAVALDDNARGFLRFALDTAVNRLTEDGAHPLSAEDMPAVVVLRKLAGGEAS